MTLEEEEELHGESGPGTLVLRGQPKVTASGPSVGRDLAALDAPNMSEVVCLEDEDSIDNALSDTSDTEYSEVDPAKEESTEDSDEDLPSPDDADGQDRASGPNLEPVMPGAVTLEPRVANVDQTLEGRQGSCLRDMKRQEIS